MEWSVVSVGIAVEDAVYWVGQMMEPQHGVRYFQSVINVGYKCVSIRIEKKTT